MTIPTKPEASAPVVTRQDREQALSIVGASGSAQVQASEHWVEFGTDVFKTFDPYRQGLKAVALAIATARHEAEARGAERERKAVVNFLRELSLENAREQHLYWAAGQDEAREAIEAGEHIAKEPA